MFGALAGAAMGAAGAAAGGGDAGGGGGGGGGDAGGAAAGAKKTGKKNMVIIDQSRSAFNGGGAGGIGPGISSSITGVLARAFGIQNLGGRPVGDQPEMIGGAVAAAQIAPAAYSQQQVPQQFTNLT